MDRRTSLNDLRNTRSMTSTADPARRRHELLGEPTGRPDVTPPSPLEIAGLLEAGLTTRQIDFLTFYRWTIGGPRFPHTIRLGWEGERTGLLARLGRR